MHVALMNNGANMICPQRQLLMLEILDIVEADTLQRLPGVVSAGHVAKLAYNGEHISAARAEKIGLVKNVYAEAVDNAALEMASEIAANALLPVRGTRFLWQGQNLSHE